MKSKIITILPVTIKKLWLNPFVFDDLLKIVDQAAAENDLPLNTFHGLVQIDSLEH